MSSLVQVAATIDWRAEGARMHEFVREAYPWPRSLTGDGVRRTLDRLGTELPLEHHSLATGEAILDWSVPREWRVREAWIAGPDGRRVVDVADHNLHLLGYSAPFRGSLSRAELEQHLHSLPQAPQLIPYRTSYWEERWGFCLPHQLRESLPAGQYEVCVDTELVAGRMDWGEVVLPGSSGREVVLSAHICHPSLANDNLSAIAVAAAVARMVAPVARRLGLRVLFAPGTVGAIAWLARNRDRVATIEAGLVLANLGDAGGLHFKQSRRATTVTDRALATVLRERAQRGLGTGVIEPFSPFGYDERQFCSPGFDLPFGSLSRTPWGRYPEYHTSADNPEFVRPEQLADAAAALLEVLAVLDANRVLRNLAPFGEPQLGRRGLYRSLGGDRDRDRELALLWVLSGCDGTVDLLAIAERAGLPFAAVVRAADDLEAAGLLESVECDVT